VSNGSQVAAFEREFAQYVGAKYCVALCNGTATLHAALVALGVKPGDRVAVPPLTMSSTTIAVLQAGATPVFVDVNRDTWLMQGELAPYGAYHLPVSLYGLNYPRSPSVARITVDDAAQTLRMFPERLGPAFVSYSFQASKILSTGEGGMLATNDEALATRAREFSSLGYRMRADQPRIDKDVLKSPTFERHYSMGWNYRLNDVTAAEGLKQLARADELLRERFLSALMYADAIAGCPWITPQRTPENWKHDHWAAAFVVDTPERWEPLAQAIVRHGGTRPFAAWRLTYHEPGFKHLAGGDCRKCGGREGFLTATPTCVQCGPGSYLSPRASCPVAESLQPRIMAMQTNDLPSAARNAHALRLAIREIGG
jgi:perosamine synthetase